MIIKNELYKLIHSRVFILVLGCALPLNLYISFSEDFGRLYSDAEYKAYYEEVEDLSLEEVLTYTQSKIDELSNSLDTQSFDYDKWVLRSMYSEQFSQLEAVSKYKEYLENIDATAQTMTSVSIFAKKDSFSYRNIVKTPPAYDPVRNVTPTFDTSFEILLAVNNTPSDLLMLFVILTAVTVVFYKDRESGVTALIKPLKYGRARLALNKTLVILLVCLSAEVALFGSNLAVGGYRFGLGDLSRPVQSLEGYLGCNLPISVAEFLALTFLFKLSALFICALIVSALFIRLKNTTAYLCAIGITAVEVALYLLISETSAFSVLKQINLAAFINTSRLFVTYTNINLFGYPINLIGATIVASVLLIIAFILLTVKLYSSISISEIKKSAGFFKHVSVPKKLWHYSAYKLLVMHKGALILAAVLAVQIYTAYDYSKAYNPADNYYLSYCNTIYGLETDDEVHEYIQSETERFEALSNALMQGANVGDELRAKEGFNLVVSQYNSAKEIAKPGELSNLMYYQTGFKDMFGVSLNGYGYDYVLGLIATLAICFAVAPIIAYDNRARIGYLLYTTKSGKKAYLKHAQVSSALFAVATSFATYIPYYFQMLDAYGVQGLNDSIRAITEYAGFASISNLGYMAILLTYRTIILIILSQLVLLISSKCKSQTTSIIICLAVFALPIIVYIAGAEFVQYISLPLSGNREVLWG